MTDERTTLTPKERMAIGRVGMPEQEPEVRAVNFREVNLGLTQQMAMLEGRGRRDEHLKSKRSATAAGTSTS